MMYRKYRTGDLPDIQIKFSELIAPLQALAQVRTDIALNTTDIRTLTNYLITYISSKLLFLGIDIRFEM